MRDVPRFKVEPGLVLGLAMLLGGVGIPPAHAQETIYIGGREHGPAVQVDMSALTRDRGIPVRRTRRGPPDILPLDPANANPARAATSIWLPPIPSSVPAQSAEDVERTAAVPAIPRAETPARNAPLPLRHGLTPAASPPPSMGSAHLNPSEPPKPISPVRPEVTEAIPQAARVKPPEPASTPLAVVALPAGLTPAKPAYPRSDAAAAILFVPGAIELTTQAAAQLDAVLASLTEKQRLQLKAHASGGQDDAEVRRTALKRALSARSHLLAAGLESTRIDVRALGPAGDGGPDDRLDVIVVAQ